MPYFVETGREEAEVEEYTMDLDDNDENYMTDEGLGVWIARFLFWLAGKVKEELGNGFGFSDYSYLNDNVLNEIEDPVLRRKAKMFTDEWYPEWKDYCVTVPSHDEILSQVEENLCNGCETAWRDVEDEHGDVIDREWMGCDERCDSFYDDVDSSMRDGVSCDMLWLEEKWDEEVVCSIDRFYAEKSAKCQSCLDRHYT